jgi:hypothetical protein
MSFIAVCGEAGFVDSILAGTGNILIQLMHHRTILNAHPVTEYLGT